MSDATEAPPATTRIEEAEAPPAPAGPDRRKARKEAQGARKKLRFLTGLHKKRVAGILTKKEDKILRDEAAAAQERANVASALLGEQIRAAEASALPDQQMQPKKTKNDTKLLKRLRGMMLEMTTAAEKDATTKTDVGFDMRSSLGDDGLVPQLPEEELEKLKEEATEGAEPMTTDERRHRRRSGAQKGDHDDYEDEAAPSPKEVTGAEAKKAKPAKRRLVSKKKDKKSDQEDEAALKEKEGKAALEKKNE